MTDPGRWQVILTRQPERIIRRLPRDLLRRIDQKLLELAIDPRPEGCKKLVGYESLYRVRVGDWRITYQVEDDRLIVLILEIAPRGGAYRNLP
jgi:mRNA interferase RelE/StbE